MAGSRHVGRRAAEGLRTGGREAGSRERRGEAVTAEEGVVAEEAAWQTVDPGEKGEKLELAGQSWFPTAELITGQMLGRAGERDRCREEPDT